MVLSLGGLALAGFFPSFGAVAFRAGYIGLLAATAWSALAAARRWSIWTVVAGSIVIYFVAGGPLADPSLTSYGFIPTASSLWGLLSGAFTGWADALVTQPPIGQIGNLLAVPLFCGVLMGAASTSVALRMSRAAPVAIIPPILVVIAAGVLGVDHPVFELQGVLFALIASAWAAYRQRVRRLGADAPARGPVGWAIAILFTALAAFIGLAVGGWGPVSGSDHRLVVRDHVVPPVDNLLLVSPLQEFRHYTVDLSDDPLFTVSGLKPHEVVTLATLNHFNGIVWQVDPSTTPSDPSSAFERIGSQIPIQGMGAPQTLQFTVGRYDDVWLPLVGEASSIVFPGPRSESLTEDIRYNLELGTGASLARFQPGEIYDETAYTSSPLAGAAAAYGTIAENAGPVPSGVIKWINGHSSAVAPTKLAEIRRLSNSLSSSGRLSDGKSSQPPSLPGHSVWRLNQFLSSSHPVGDAEQFSAALALMAQDIGLPARVVVGFQPGAKGSGRITVYGRNITAWVEVSNGLNWVSLFPTPKVSTSPLIPPHLQQPPPNESQPPQPQPPVAAPTNSHSGRGRSTTACGASEHCGGSFSIPAWVALTVGIPLAIVFLLTVLTGSLVLLKTSRRRKRRTDGTTSARIAGGWAELCDLIRDMGGVVPATATRRECAVLVATPGVAAVAKTADSLIFGPGEISEYSVDSYWENLEVTRTGILGSMTLINRWKTLVNLSSLGLSKARLWRPRNARKKTGP